jgi:hypothetical protein
MTRKARVDPPVIAGESAGQRQHSGRGAAAIHLVQRPLRSPVGRRRAPPSLAAHVLWRLQDEIRSRQKPDHGDPIAESLETLGE